MRNPILLFLLLLMTTPAQAGVTTIDLLKEAGFEVNAAGPILVRADATRNRVIAVNTLSSSVTVIDGETDAVTNIAVGRRGLQHLKAAALAIREQTGTVYFLGVDSLMIVDPDSGTAHTVETAAQFESVAIDDATGNAFLVGRESNQIGFWNHRQQQLKMVPWLEHSETLVNLNQTPPPPSRRVVAFPATAERKAFVAAVDGHAAMLYRFDPKSGRQQGQPTAIPLQAGGRWHLAGADPGAGVLYLVTETDDRRVIQAGRIDVDGPDVPVVVDLPEHTEGVGMVYDPVSGFVYVNYDNHPTIHVVAFAEGGSWWEIPIPAFGNDAVAIDHARQRMYIASWAHGEVEVVDLEQGRFLRKIEGLGIIPHMHAMTFNDANGQLYFPVGASAVNGCFGASVTRLDPVSGEAVRIQTGWAPIDLIERPGHDSVLVFDNEHGYAEVTAGGTVVFHDLPRSWPLHASDGPDGTIYLAYGPHQSYWPVVYIWAARNGILSIDPQSLETYDRRIPRQPLEMALDEVGVLYLPQNNWGGEKQFVNTLKDGVRNLEIRERMELPDEVTRETTQRVLRYDEATRRLYLLRTGETDDQPSVLQVIDPDTEEVVQRLELGRNATDLLFDETRIYVANFGSDTVSVIDKQAWTVEEVPTGAGPLKLAQLDGRIWVLNHVGRSLQEIGGGHARWDVPTDGLPDQVVAWNGSLVVTVHSPDDLALAVITPGSPDKEYPVRVEYPFGETRFDTPNSAFYMSGQFGDAVFDLTSAEVDSKGRLWLADFLSGTVLLLSP